MNKRQTREKHIAEWLKLPVDDRDMRCLNVKGEIELSEWICDGGYWRPICIITLRSIIAKRYPARKKKKAVATK